MILLYIALMLIIWYFSWYRSTTVTRLFSQLLDAYSGYLHEKTGADPFVDIRGLSYWGWFRAVFNVRTIDYHLFMSDDEYKEIRAYVRLNTI